MTPARKPDDWDIGTGVRGYVWRSAAPRAALLLQHGYGEYAERFVDHYHRLIPRLTDVGIDVFAIDMRGHGRSSGPRAVTDVNQAVSDHQAARRAIDTGGKPLFLFGHSLGGLVTAVSVARDQTGTAGVILSAPALLIEAPQALRWIAQILGAVAPGFGIAAPQPASRLSRIPEEVIAFESDALIYRGKMPARLGASSIRVAAEGWRCYERWEVPVLVFHGTDDSHTAPRGSQAFVDRIRADDKTIRLLPDGRHELLNDLSREVVLTDLMSWIERRLV